MALTRSSRGSSEYSYNSLSLRPKWKMNQASLLASPGGSTALSCHCSMRWVWVKEPYFSAIRAQGMKKNSVGHSFELTLFGVEVLTVPGLHLAGDVLVEVVPPARASALVL